MTAAGAAAPSRLGYNDAITAWEAAESARLLLERRASRVGNLRQSHAIRAIAVTLHAGVPQVSTFTFTDAGGGAMEFQGCQDSSGRRLGGLDLHNLEFYPGGPTLQMLTETLHEHGAWNDPASVEDSFEPDCHRFTVNIAAVLAAPAPYDELEASPRTRSLTEAEQDALVEAAFHLVPVLEDEIAEGSDHEAVSRKEFLLRSLNALLMKPTPPAVS